MFKDAVSFVEFVADEFVVDYEVESPEFEGVEAPEFEVVEPPEFDEVEPPEFEAVELP